MKLVTYSKDESVSCGMLTDKGLIDIPSAWRWSNRPRSVKEILQCGPSCKGYTSSESWIRDVKCQLTN